MDTILTVKPEHLHGLDAQQAVELLRDLLWAEATRVGLSRDKVNVTSRIAAPDGGVDGTVEGNAGMLQGSFLASGQNSYQVKTGTSFHPWQRSALVGELFNGRRRKENLGRRIRDCLDHEGKYVLVCFGHDLGSKRDASKTILVKLLHTCGYHKPDVDVWDAITLIGFLGHFPALALRLNRPGASQFVTHREWSTHDDMRNTFRPGPRQCEQIEGIRSELRYSDNPVHIRVCGEAGIGKTRLVLEATREDDLSPLVVFSDALSFLHGSLVTELVRDDTLHAILVLDECDSDARADIWNKLRYHSPRIRLVTVYGDCDAASGISRFNVEPLERTQVSAIIQDYGVPTREADAWAAECGGSPRLAHMVGQNLIAHPEDLLLQPGTVNVWNRMVAGPHDPESIEVKRTHTVLRYLALFRRFGFDPPMDKEAVLISELVRQRDPEITWARFRGIIKELRNRKLLQGERTVYITPRLLHVWLWTDCWEKYGDSHFLGELLNPLMSASPALLDWFLEMFEYAAGSPAAQRTVADILGPQGLFRQKPEILNEAVFARFFRAVAKADPVRAMECLTNTLGTWGPEQLRQFIAGRRDIVWALEEIARWPQLFQDAARLLLALGEAENETWSNNASGVFAGLFTISQSRELSRTGASPGERFPVLKEALESPSSERRALALRACECALQRPIWGPATGHRIVGPTREGWAPSTWGQLFDAYRQVWNYLYCQLDVLSAEERSEGIRVLLQSAHDLATYGNLSDMVLNTIRQLSCKTYVDKKQIIENVIRIRRHIARGLPPEARQQWQQLQEAVVGSSFHAQMQRYVGMWLVEDLFDEDGKRLNVVEDIIRGLAQQAYDDPSLLAAELPWLVTREAKNAYSFGYELGRDDRDLSLLGMIRSAQLARGADADGAFIGGYLRALYERDPENWEELLDEFSRDSGLKELVPELTWRTGKVSDRAALRVLGMAQKGIIQHESFGMFVYGGTVQSIAENILADWVEFLVSREERGAVHTALALCSFFYVRREPHRRPPEQLTLQLLTSPTLFDRAGHPSPTQMVTYYWTNVAMAFVADYPEASLQLGKTMLQHLGEPGTIVEGYHSPIYSVLTEIARHHPAEMWHLAVQSLEGAMDIQGLAVRQWLRGQDLPRQESPGALDLISPDVVWAWVEDEPDTRARLVAGFVPKTLASPGDGPCWARELLIRYGDREDVRRKLVANFSSEIWTGPESLHLRKKREDLLKLLDSEDDSRVRLWISMYASELEKDIAGASISEEREWP